MPECAIGLIPDGGVFHFLGNLIHDESMFLYILLVGARLSYYDCLNYSISTDHTSISFERALDTLKSLNLEELSDQQFNAKYKR